MRHYLQVEGGDWLAQARAEFQAMVETYTASTVRNRDLIGHAYARLALIASQIDEDPQAAIPLYEEAIALVTPRWQALYQIELGDVYVAMEDLESARRSFDEAQSIAELYGNEDLVERAGERLTALP